MAKISWGSWEGYLAKVTHKGADECKSTIYKHDCVEVSLKQLKSPIALMTPTIHYLKSTMSS